MPQRRPTLQRTLRVDFGSMDPTRSRYVLVHQRGSIALIANPSSRAAL